MANLKKLGLVKETHGKIKEFDFCLIIPSILTKKMKLFGKIIVQQHQKQQPEVQRPQRQHEVQQPHPQIQDLEEVQKPQQSQPQGRSEYEEKESQERKKNDRKSDRA